MWYSETLGVIKTPRPISKDGIQHPRNIFRLWSKEALANIGIRPARVVTPDSRYYNTGGENYELVDGEWVISYTSSEKDADQLKVGMKQKVKQIASSTLAHSDWMTHRESDGGTAMPSDWKTYRSDVRAMSNTKETEISALTDLNSVKAYQNDPIVEVRYTSTYAEDGTETIGPGTESHNREVDKVGFGWPTAPDANLDPYHVRYE